MFIEIIKHTTFKTDKYRFGCSVLVVIGYIKNFKGTKVTFVIAKDSKKKLNDVFKKYSNELYEFSKTKIEVKLYKLGTEYISRSQARRIISGLDKFKEIILNFKGVKTVGQDGQDRDLLKKISP